MADLGGYHRQTLLQPVMLNLNGQTFFEMSVHYKDFTCSHAPIKETTEEKLSYFSLERVTKSIYWPLLNHSAVHYLRIE